MTSETEILPARTDILVLGAGMAGYCAAIAAAEAGAEVLLLEKAAAPGGSSAQSGGGFLFVGTDLQASAGPTSDSLEALRTDYLESGRHLNDPALVDVLVEDQLATYEFLRAHGVQFSLSNSRPGAYTRAHVTGLGRAVAALHKAAMDTPQLRLATNSAGTRLHRSVEGRVDRVTVSVRGRMQEIEVERAVVLATGGFSRSRKLLQTYAPELVEAVKHGGIANTGDGLVMATALGAGHADLGFVSGSYGGALRNYPNLSGETDDFPPLILAFTAGAIMVNKNGVRFADESQSYKLLSGVGAAQPGGLAFQIFDQKLMDASGTGSVNNFADALAKGYIIRADTVGELAAAMRLDPAVVEATVESYNLDARRSGVDSQFGRKIGVNTKGEPMTVDVAPFFGVATTNMITSTYGGITVNCDMAVVDQFGDPISGLYAAGEVAGGFYGALYLSGSALVRSAITGRRAGVRAAALARPLVATTA